MSDNKLEKYLQQARVELYGEEVEASSLIHDLHEKLIHSFSDHLKEIKGHVQTIAGEELDKIEKKYGKDMRKEVLAKLSDMAEEMAEHKHAALEVKILNDCL